MREILLPLNFAACMISVATGVILVISAPEAVATYRTQILGWMNCFAGVITFLNVALLREAR